MNDGKGPGAGVRLLEGLAAAVLVAVLLALAYVVAAAYQPTWAGWATTEAQVVVMLALLTAALLLVSAVALLHTRA
jgi:hypothetical protein